MGYRTSVSIAVLVGVLRAAQAQQATIVIESGSVRADDLHFAVRLDSTVEVSGVQNDILLDSGIAIARRANGRPDCQENPSIEKAGSSFAFQPTGCIPGDSCIAVRALVLSFHDLSPIPDGSSLYSCRLAADTPPGDYTLACANAGASDPNGVSVGAGCVDGEITVESSTVLRAGFAASAAGETVAIDVTSYSNEAATGIAVDLDFAPLLARGVSGPACVPAGGATATFAFLPDGCSPGVTCTGVHAALESAAPFATGETLFTCGVDLPAGAARGEYPVRLANGSGDAPAHVTTADGLIRVTGPPRSPTEPSMTPTPARSTIEIGSASGAPGDTVEIAVTLRTDEIVGGVQNDLHFDPRAPIAAADGQPACVLAAGVDWFPASTIAFQPPACVPDVTCTGVRAVLLTATAGGVIPDGAALYTCTVAIDPAARGSVALPCSNQLGSTPQGQAVPLNCAAGRIDVVEPSATPSATPLPTTTPVSGSNPQTGGSSNSGCAISEPAAGGWWLLPPLMLLARMRAPGGRRFRGAC
jgi:hypothetical protein